MIWNFAERLNLQDQAVSLDTKDQRLDYHKEAASIITCAL